MITGLLQIDLSTTEDSPVVPHQGARQQRLALSALDSTPTGARVIVYVGDRRPTLHAVWAIVQHQARLDITVHASTPTAVTQWLELLHSRDAIAGQTR